MSATAIIFYILAALVLTFGVLTVFSRKIFRAAVYLLLSLISVAGIYLCMDMEFIAALQIIIYVGGIVVLIIFSIFLTHQAGERLPSRLVKWIVPAVIISVSGLALALYSILGHTFTASSQTAINPSVENIGLQLLDYKTHGYVLPFEIVSILLLAALVGSIVIAIKDKKTN